MKQRHGVCTVLDRTPSGGRPPLTGAQAYSLRILVCSLSGDVPKTAVYVKAVSCRPGHARDDDDDVYVCVRARARALHCAGRDRSGVADEARASAGGRLRVDRDATSPDAGQTRAGVQGRRRQRKVRAPVYSFYPPRSCNYSTGPDLRGPRASHQQRASYQTVHISFLANVHLPISCFILFTNRKICGCQAVPARSVAQIRPVFLWDVCLSDSLSV